MLNLPRLSALPGLLVRWAAWALLGMSLLVGVVWTLLHFWIVPRIPELRPQLQAMATSALGMPVQLGELRVASNGWAPVLEIDDIQLHNTQGEVALRLPKVRVVVSANALLTLGVEQLSIEGADLDVRRSDDGRLWIAGHAWPSHATAPSPAADWLFAQKEVVLHQGQVHWTDALSMEPRRTVTLTGVNIQLHNSARQHDVRVKATPPEAWGSGWSASGQFRRGLLSTHAGRLQDWSGNVIAELPDVDLAPLGRQVATGMVLSSGEGRLSLRLNVLNGQPHQASADVALSRVNLALGPQLRPLQFDSLEGRMTGRQDTKGFEVSTEDLMFETPDGLRWPGGNLALKYTYGQGATLPKGQLDGDRLNLQALQSIASRLPLNAESQLQAWQVNGLVKTLHAQWEGHWPQWTRYEAQGRMEGLSAQPLIPHTVVPGLQNANLDFNLTQAGGKLTLDMDKGSVSLNGILDNPWVPVETLQADVSWSVKNELLQVPQWRLKMRNADVTADLNGHWHMNKDGGPGTLDLQGRLLRADAAQVYRYLPKIWPADVRQYVQDAFTKGEISQMAVRIKGDLKDLPFANPKSGEFRLAGKVRDLNMNYVPTRLQAAGDLPWPALTGLQGDLVFERLGVKLSNASGKINNIPLVNAQATIADMTHAAMLEVNAESRSAQASDVLGLVQQSPLDRLLHQSLHEASANGGVSARVKISMPLAAVEKTRLQGSLVLGGNDLRLTPELPLLEKSTGNVSFTETGYTVSNGQARTLGGSMRIDGGSRTNPTGNDYSASLRLQGNVTAQGLQQAQELAPLNKLAQRMTGSTAYTAAVGFRQGHAELSVQSSLQGLGLNLPSPLTKAPGDELALRMDTRILNEDSRKPLRDQIQLSLGRLVAATYVRDLSGANPLVIQGSLGMGLERVQAPPLPESGVVANLALPRFSIDEWMAAWNGSASNPAPVGNPNSPLARSTDDLLAATFLPTRMALQAQELVFQGRTLHHVVVGGSREGLLWRANLDAQEFSGYLEYRQSSGNNLGRVYARLSRLNLPPTVDTVVEQLLENGPVDIPALDIVVEDLELRGKKLGRIEIEAVNSLAGPRNAAEWRLNKLNVTVPEASFKATGRWVTAKSIGLPRSTEMNFRLDIEDAGALLNRLGTQDAMRAGAGRLEGQVAWSGSPLAMNYPSMDGRFNVSIQRGQFLKADPGVAKLLGVLSLQALPRRLLLDFRDVFAEGFSYDVIRGDVSIDKGIASTHNLQMKGVNALVQMEGTSDIAKESQKLRVVILPEVDAGTASLLAGIAVNPVVGLSTFLAQLFLRNPLSKAATQSFLIDGTWSNPKVTKIEAPTAATPAQ